MIKDFRDKKHQPITMKEIREEEAEAERKRLEDEQRPIREAESKLTATHRKLIDLARSEIAAGRADPGFTVPESVKSLNMTVPQAQKYVAATSQQFMDEVPEAHRYFPDVKNFDAICSYLWNCGVKIPNVEAWKLAFERCKATGLIHALPESQPEPVPVEQPEQFEHEVPKEEELVDGVDPITRQPRRFTQRELYLMDSETYRRAMSMHIDRSGTDKRPRFNRSRYL